mgnify:CR=1 FL=1
MESSVTNTTRVTLFLGAGLAVIGSGLWIRSADAPPAPRAGSESNPSALDDDPALQIEQLRQLEREIARAAGSAPIPARGVPSAPLASAASSAEAQPSALDDERFLDRSVETLMARLSSDDDHLVLDAADGLRARKAVQAIPKLAEVPPPPEEMRNSQLLYNEPKYVRLDDGGLRTLQDAGLKLKKGVYY